VSHSSLLPNHILPVAPSAIPVTGEIHTFDGKVAFETPRPLETEEIPGVVEEYRRAAELSITAGFDGVELHAATGYPPNQFQVTGSNRRTDAYGGSLEGRTRFTLEVIEALCSAHGGDRVGIKIAPGFTVNDTFDDDPAETYTYLARRLNPLGLAYLHVGYNSGYGGGTAPAFNPIDQLRPVYSGTLLAVGGFTKASGEAALAAGRADLIEYGRPFLANPDLVERFRVEAPLNQGDVRMYYGGDDRGYTDYPTLAQEGWRP
jgi:N-ethylmaleimide reductase